MSKIVLDTSAYSQLASGNTFVQDWLEQATTVFMSEIVIGELLAGYKFGRREQEHIQTLNQFLVQPNQSRVSITSETTLIYAEILQHLKTQGTPIPSNDIWIAAQSIEHGAQLLTFDHHFGKVPGLRVCKLV